MNMIVRDLQEKLKTPGVTIHATRIPPRATRHYRQTYPRIRIDLVLVHGPFAPELIERISRRLGIPKNYMFIGTPGDQFPHNFADLGGVRLIR